MQCICGYVWMRVLPRDCPERRSWEVGGDTVRFPAEGIHGENRINFIYNHYEFRGFREMPILWFVSGTWIRSDRGIFLRKVNFMDPAVVTLCVLAVACFLFVTELIPLAVTAMAACTALGILGVLPSKQVYAGLSNSTVVLFGGMFVIGAAMFRTCLLYTSPSPRD